MQLFNQGTLKDYLTTRLYYLREEVQAEDRDHLLNMNETNYVNYLVETYTVDPLVIDCDQVSISDREERFPADAFPRSNDMRRGQWYPRQVITYHIPCSGNADLLGRSPAMRQAYWELEVQRNQDSISFDIVAWQEDPQQVSREADQKISSIRMHAQNVAQEVAEFNQNLEKTAQRAPMARRIFFFRIS